eukprot:UN21958
MGKKFLEIFFQKTHFVKILLTKDFSKSVKELRAQWIMTPSNPGSKGNNEDKLSEAIEEALFAMKCLLNGKQYTPGVENKEDPDVFNDMETFEYTCKGKKDRCKKAKVFHLSY